MDLTFNEQKIRVTKLEELPDAKNPNNKEVGYFKEGYPLEKPEVNRKFWLRTGELLKDIWCTSLVTEVIDEKTFRTRNSIYQITNIN